MKRTFRLRRVAAAAVLGMGMTAGVIGVAAGTAGAAVHATIKATSAPSVGSTGTGVGAGSLTITLPAGTALTGKVTHLKVSASGGGTVDWVAKPTVSHTSGTATVTVTATATTTLNLTVTKAAGTSDTIHLTNVRYDLTGAHGTIKVTPTPTPTATKGTLVYTPTHVVNAKAPGAPASAPAVKKITATSTPSIGRASGQAAGNWTVTLTASTKKTTALKEGWRKTEAVTISVKSNAKLNCTGTTGTDYVIFTGVPTATVSAATGVSTTPKVSVSTAAVSPCSGANHNEAVVTFTNTGTFTAATGSFTIALSGVKYNVGKTTATGKVAVTAKFTTTGFGTPTTVKGAATKGASNASVAKVYVTADTPAVTVTPGAFDAAISPVKVVETTPSSVASGEVCLSLKPHTTAANVFNTKATAKASVVTGDGTVTATVTYENKTGNAATTTASAVFARFTVKRESLTKASTYEVSGLKVNASTTSGTVTVVVTHVAATAGCTTSPATIGTATAYSIKKVTKVIYGATADATAAKELETRFPATTAGTTKTDCVGGHKNSANTRPVILATTKTYQDALSSSYLAGYLDTGTLLTPTTMLSSVTKQALRTEGVTQVDVVGGPLAITTTVVAQIETLPAYSCGGVSPLKTGKTTVFIHVTRIYGQTQYDTAQMIAETVPELKVGKMTFPGAYAGVNATKGDGMYNDTAGTASTAPLTSAEVPTAIVTSGVEFQDAMAASAVAYGTSLPVLLTAPTKLSSQAAAVIATLGIKQVILMGGQLAVSNTVVKQLQALGVSVLRVAGKNYTDTAVQLAMFEQNTRTVSGLGWPTRTTAKAGKMTSFFVARGNGFTDALAGAVITGNTHLPQLLTFNQTTVGSALTAFLKAAGQSGKGVNTDGTAKLTSFEVFGGPLAVTPTVINKIETDIS